MKLKIDNDLLAEEFFDGAYLLGIVAPIKNYQFVWHLNRQLGYTFRLNSDIEIELIKKTRKYFFLFMNIRLPKAL
jgi:hypothetical protein